MTAMTDLNVPDAADDRRNIPVVIFATIFAVVTYAAISTRAVLNPYEIKDFIEAKRFFSVLVGAFILWLSIRAAERLSGQGPGAQVFAVLNVAIPGAIGLLLAREAYDLAASGEFAQRLALNIRWMLTWIGYFAAAVAGFLALTAHQRLQSVVARAKVDYTEHSVAEALAEDGYEHADWNFDPRTST